MFGIHEIFSSLQGEGRWHGRPATFIRFGTCNLACPWCDTRNHVNREMTLVEVLESVKRRGNHSVVVTGGEPSIQPDLPKLVGALKKAGYWIALETNGLLACPGAELFDYVAVSPKYMFQKRYLDEQMLRRADEVRIVAENREMDAFCVKMRQQIAASSYYISPIEDGGRIHYRRACDLVTRLNKKNTDLDSPWMLSIQMHKVIGLR